MITFENKNWVVIINNYSNFKNKFFRTFIGLFSDKKIYMSANKYYSTVIFQYRTEEDFIKKEEKKVKLLKETIPFYLNKFEQTIVENGGFAVGSTVS